MLEIPVLEAPALEVPLLPEAPLLPGRPEWVPPPPPLDESLLSGDPASPESRCDEPPPQPATARTTAAARAQNPMVRTARGHAIRVPSAPCDVVPRK